jgi:hypothetical protein
MLFQFQIKKILTKSIKYQISNALTTEYCQVMSDQTQYQMPSPTNIVRLSDDKQVIFVEWP